MGELKIYLRRGEDWTNVSSDDHLEKIRRDGFRSYVTTEGHKLFVRNLEEWRRRSDMSFVEYRARLRQIAEESWRATGLEVVTADDSHIRRIRAAGIRHRVYDPPGSPLLAITDDDDCFVSGIGPSLKTAFDDPGVRIVHWDSYIYSVFGQACARSRTWKTSLGPHALHSRQFASNGYVVRTPCTAGWATTHSMISRDLGVSKDLSLQRHVRSGNDLYRTRTPKGTLWIPQPLSVYMRHPASTLLLRTRTLQTVIGPLLARGVHAPVLPDDVRSMIDLRSDLLGIHMDEIMAMSMRVCELTRELLARWRS